jgi:hypothetical protein
MTPDELQELLRLHERWIDGDEDGQRADLRGVDLREADLCLANLTGADMRGAILPAGIPVIPDIHRAVYDAASAPGALNMDEWNCRTAHCRAGWVVALAGEEGAALEELLDTSAAAALIYYASDPTLERVPDWYVSNEDALADMARLAGVTHRKRRLDMEIGSEEWTRLLPAWFVPRMAGDCWFFALILTNGQALYVESIENVRMSADENLWIDVLLHPQSEADSAYWKIKGVPLVGAPTSRTQASVNARHVVYAVEMADT